MGLVRLRNKGCGRFASAAKHQHHLPGTLTRVQHAHRRAAHLALDLAAPVCGRGRPGSRQEGDRVGLAVPVAALWYCGWVDRGLGCRAWVGHAGRDDPCRRG